MLCAVACRGGMPPPAPGTVVVALESAPAVLDPRYTTDANSSLVADLVTRGLTRMNERAEPVPDLADAWQQPSPLEYRFTLRPDATFSDGAPVTAADVVATYRSVLDPALRSPKREAVAPITDVVAVDPRTVVIRVRATTASFLETTNLGILPAALADHGPLPPDGVVGAGPFRVAATLPDGSVELAASETAMDGAPSIARLRFRVIPDGTVRALELASGTVHVVQNALELRRRVSQVSQDEFGTIGLLDDVRIHECAPFHADARRGAFQLHSLDWVGAPAPAVYYRILPSSMQPPVGTNRCAYANPVTD